MGGRSDPPDGISGLTLHHTGIALKKSVPILSLMVKLLSCLAFTSCAVVSAFAVPTVEEVNQSFGLPVFSTQPLWQEKPAAIAERLRLPKESETASSQSFRAYTGESARVLGIRPYSVALTAEDGKTSQLSFMFTNTGDFGNLSDIRKNLEAAVGKAKTDLKKQERDALTAFPAAFKTDFTTLLTTFTKLFGPPDGGRDGTSRSTTEKTQRWKWNSHVFQLATKDNRYVALRILPEEAESAKPARNARLRERLKGSVERRPNGDVVITGIPMVDQGPKGFCVAATMDRVLKYVGVPSDMYVLAVAGGTEMGGGARPEEMIEATADLARSAGTRFEKAGGSVKIPAVARYIDNGTPLIWEMQSIDGFDKSLSERAAQRKQTTDPKAWKATLKAWRKMVGRVKSEGKDGHVCMIIGYNKDTDELAVSDSWGPEYAERWITVEEAEMISDGQLFTISP